MSHFSENWKEIIKTSDFIIGTCFLFLLFSMFFVQELNLPGEQFLFGSLFLLLLGGFFLYIFTPKIVEFGRLLFSTTERRLIPPFSVFIIFAIYRFIVPTSPDFLTSLVQVISGFFFILTPTLLYLSFSNQTRDGLSYIDVLAGLWVWLPIEFGLVDDLLGKVELGDIPFDTLLALFAFIYALIFVRFHDMGLTFSLSKEDLLIAGKANGILVLIILPLGIISYFLAPPDIILEKVMNLTAELPVSLVDIILTFILIFLGTALIEEMFFRGFIFNLIAEKLENGNVANSWLYGGILGLIGLIIITPWIDDIIDALSWIPLFSPLKEIIGSLAEPLGDAEGQVWPLVQNVPLEALYFMIAIILGIFGFLLVSKTKDPIITALVLSSILFGWAHFEDIRYIFFASFAGFAYGWTYWKTQKIVPAALVHMAVDAVWSIFLNF